MTYTVGLLTFVETKLFTALAPRYLSDDEYAELQQALIAAPEAGDVIRGGVRVIYYLRTRQGQIWMLTLYAKNEAESIPAHLLKKIKEEIGG